MGYCVQQIETKVFIPRKSFPAVVTALKALVKREPFSYTPTDPLPPAAKFDETIEYFCFSPSLNAKGDLVALEYFGEKLDAQNAFFEALAPFVRKGGIASFRGEDGTKFRWEFDGRKVECSET